MLEVTYVVKVIMLLLSKLMLISQFSMEIMLLSILVCYFLYLLIDYSK